MVYTLRFFSSSKWSLFHNSNIFGSSIIHILYTGCAEIKKKQPLRPKVNPIRPSPSQATTDSLSATGHLFLPQVISFCHRSSLSAGPNPPFLALVGCTETDLKESPLYSSAWLSEVHKVFLYIRHVPHSTACFYLLSFQSPHYDARITRVRADSLSHIAQ